MLKLDRVTVCAADCLNPHLAALAIERCLRACDFGDAVLFTDRPVDSPVRQVRIDRLGSQRDYSRFMLGRLHEFIATPYLLVVQWDGFVLDATRWRDDFLDFDYIGSPWLSDGNLIGMVMGNGGFSLRSRRLHEIVARLPLQQDEDEFEDRVICQGYRRWLELERGIRFAPVPLAEAFSFEERTPAGPTFGFHGLWHLPGLLGDGDTLAWVRQADPATWLGGGFLRLAGNCLLERRLDLAGGLFDLALTAHGQARVRERLEKLIPAMGVADNLLSMGTQAALRWRQRAGAVS